MTQRSDHEGNRGYYAYDGLGSPTSTVSGTGNVTQYRYDPFGEQLSGPTAGQPFRFTGEQQDADVARDPYYLRARYYDPEIGRFWSKDPWRGSTALPQTLDGYSYVGNNPTNAADPRGLCHPVLCWDEGAPIPIWPGSIDVPAPELPFEFDPGGAPERWRSLWGGVSSIFGGGQDEAHRWDRDANPGHISILEGLSQMGDLGNFVPRCGLIKNFRHARLVRRVCRGIASGVAAGLIGCAALEATAPVLWGEKPPRCPWR